MNKINISTQINALKTIHLYEELTGLLNLLEGIETPLKEEINKKLSYVEKQFGCSFVINDENDENLEPLRLYWMIRELKDNQVKIVRPDLYERLSCEIRERINNIDQKDVKEKLYRLLNY